MTKLSKLPEIKPSVIYPPFELEGKIKLVEKTDPQLYVDEIKRLTSEIKDYVKCLEYKGYSVTYDIKTGGGKATKTTTLL